MIARKLNSWPLLVLALVAACSESPTAPSGDDAAAGREVVITQGAAAPAPVRPPRPVFSDFGTVSPSLGGSATSPLTLLPQTCPNAEAREVVVTYQITGRQANVANFKVNTHWEYNGSTWVGSMPVTVEVPARAAMDDPTLRTVTLTITNASSVDAGASTLVVPIFDLQTTPPAALGDDDSDVTIFVQFESCATPNTEPTLVVPNDMTVEATSSAGAQVDFVVTATDLEDGDLTDDVVCTPASGSTFPLGTTTVVCQVTDSGGLTTTRSFTITIVDTTPAYFTSFPTGTIQLIAADINGAVLDINGLGIAVADVGGVSEPSTWACSYVEGTVLEIGSTTTVSCTASDARGNTSEPSTFDVFVGLNVNGTGFLPPLRMAAPYSSHKRGSTIPHKFLPPTYADGTPATDLADGLRLVVKQIDGSVSPDGIDVTDSSSGSTEWRYDPESGHYIFNLKTTTSSPWVQGTWQTTVSYKGIPLASTYFELKK